MSKSRSSIPVLTLPTFGSKLPEVRPKYRTYDSRRVRRARLLMLTAEPLCRRCGGVAVEVHHIVPLSAGGHAWDFRNLEPLCVACHAGVHGKRRGPKPKPPPPAPERAADWCPVY